MTLHGDSSCIGCDCSNVYKDICISMVDRTAYMCIHCVLHVAYNIGYAYKLRITVYSIPTVGPTVYAL